MRINFKVAVCPLVATLFIAYAGPLLAEQGDISSAKDDISMQVESNNATGLDLFEQLRAEKGNIVISPYSIGTAMSMALTGAEGSTRKEMADVMHQTMDDQALDRGVGALHQKINDLSGKDITIETVNALCLTSDAVSKNYQMILKNSYSAELFKGRSVAPINEWVKKKTRGKIPKLLETLSNNSVCVILNAIYFKGLWADKFDKKRTKEERFTCEDSKQITVPMMHQYANFKIMGSGDFQIMEMPFAGKKVNLLLLLPRKNRTLKDLEKKMSFNEVQDLIKKMKRVRKVKVTVSLPRFKIEYKTSLVKPFLSLGMKKAFSDEADFGKISGLKNRPGYMRISQIQHSAFIEINEDGGEAAAATAVAISSKCAAMPRFFKADRPFLFFITDSETNSILFMGRVAKPL